MKPQKIFKVMLLLFLFGNSFFEVVKAQVVFTIESSTAEEGDHLCLNIKVNNFNSILSSQFTLEWDPAILMFDSIGGFGLSGLSQSNFGINKADKGIISLSWIDFTANGKSLKDGAVLFKICMKVIGKSGSSSTIDIVSNPIQIEITDINSNGENIGAIINSGIVTVNSSSASLYFDSTHVNLAEQSCNKLTVKNIKSIQKLTGTIAWDSSKLSFDSICCVHPGINFSSINTFQSANGVILLNIDQGSPININNINELFGVCLNAIGKIGDHTSIEINNSWFPYELKALPTGSVKVSKGTIDITLKDLRLKGSNIKAQKGMIVELPLVITHDVILKSIQGSLQFDPNKLSFIGIRKGKLSGISEDSLNLLELNIGQIGYKWSANGILSDLHENDSLFYLRFQIIGDKGLTHLFANDNIFPQVANIQNNTIISLAVQFDTSSIIILPPDMHLSGENTIGKNGDTVCIKLFVNDFKNVSSLQLSIDYDPNLLTAIGVNGINLPNNPKLTYYIQSGKLKINWKDYFGTNGFSINQGEALLEMCFVFIGKPGDEAHVVIDSVNSFYIRADYLQDSLRIKMNSIKCSILLNSLLAIDSFIKNNPCEGDKKAEIKIMVLGGKPPFVFNWTDGVNSQSRSNLSDGNYTVTILDSSIPQQIVSSSFEIKHYANNPIVSPINDIHLKCPNESIEVNANVSNMQISWIGNGNGIHPQMNGKALINLPGNYVVKIYDVNTSCFSLDSFEVFDAPILEAANAGIDQHVCEEVLLNAIQTDSVFGVWTSLGKSKIANPNQKSTEVLTLESGANQFVWTISTKECYQYDTDTVWAFVPFPPIAIDDNLNIQSSNNINILENDLSNNGSYSLSFPDKLPSEVKIDKNGFLTYIPGFNALPIEIQYNLCDNKCPTLCSSALINIYSDTSIIEPSNNKVIPNVISPNNDGINDNLVFPQLDLLKYPNAKICIFDRSGRVIYRNNHYQNDWNGVDSDLHNLAVDTYYYVLWLSIGDGLSLKGSITILR